MYFQNYRLQKRWLDKFLNSPVSEDPWTCNMVITPKHCFSINNITFSIFIDHGEGNWVGKSLSW